jgi:hypothetical protein
MSEAYGSDFWRRAVLEGKGILSDIQIAFLELFAGLSDQDQFYLTGGTALAEYYLGHRLSYDLDLFTSQSDLIIPFSFQVERAAKAANIQIEVVRRFESFVEFQVKMGEEILKVDLALDAPFRFSPPEMTKTGVLVNGLKDIQADKTLAYFSRAEPRDAIDLFFLLQDVGIDRLVYLAQQKDPGFDLYWFAVSLNQVTNFPNEIERWPVKMLMACDVVELKRIFLELAMRVMTDLTEDN